MSFFSPTAYAGINAKNPAHQILGLWMTQTDDAKVEIIKRDNKFYGKIMQLLPHKKETLDIKNPKKELQSRKIWGLEMLADFVYDKSSNQWDKGTIYDPKSGQTYQCYMTLLSDGRLKVRGYVGVSWLGKTVKWTRTTAEAPLTDPKKKN